MDIPRRKRKLIGSMVGIGTILFFYIFRLFPEYVERMYSNGLFPIIRFFFDHSLSLVSLPWVFILALWVIFRIIRSLIRQIKEMRGAGIKKRIASAGLSIGGFLGWGAFVFYFFWGMNYARIPMEKKIEFLDDEEEVNFALVAETALVQCINLRKIIPMANGRALEEKDLPDTLADHMRRMVKLSLAELNYSAPGNPAVKSLRPGWILGSFRASGVYLPFTGEAYTQGNLPPSDRPFILAHELSHAFGLSSELECNFVAWLACMRSDFAIVKYSGQLEYLSMVMRDLIISDKQAGETFEKLIPEDILTDIQVSKDYYQSNHTFISRLNLHRNVFNFFLKTQGQKLGVKGYAKFSSWVRQWKKRSITN